ncbi:sir2 family histone deacetylase [Grosmannia clavigera kw1407]|uniref:Sir2 family histone deacetylase n=1 Tax=Grosmannia clavigera (strain kw1407 / UAMH 11150) TaxID=655863 RepID=F0XJ94_GROCL|nr:sir2 family histone deacetylase [Grosmannia clavigera kw1407]EFX02440.1 sir2 family histone deacetylase [Grosmannia clavigera kw1407]
MASGLFAPRAFSRYNRLHIADQAPTHARSAPCATTAIGRHRKQRHRQRWTSSDLTPSAPSRRRAANKMGQEASSQIDESVPPVTLSERSIEAVARYIRDGRARKIVALTGAGISTAAGIPDFRSPGTGLYANLKRLNLPYAEAVFSIDYFRQNPRPFYVLAKELYPGQFHPTVSHAFLALLACKGLLNMLFTQNIDCLERAAGVPADRIVEAHGSFATQRCIDCGTAFDDAAMRDHVREARVPRCGQPGCGGLVKPDIVFFGESLPSRFHELTHETPSSDGTDLLLVLGTSLTVYPFAGLPSLAPDGVPRVLFNREQVGDLGERPDDVLALGSCDDGVRRLAAALGWQDELNLFWRQLVGDIEADRQLRQDVLLVPPPNETEKETKQAGQTSASVRPAAADEVDEIADEIAAILRLDANTDKSVAGA